jgi:hypothetical protein
MIEAPSLLSISLTSRAADKPESAIEDQDADFVFKFVSHKSCRYY